MISTTELGSIAGKTLHGRDGKIGRIVDVDVYESTEGSDGTFVTVSTGMFGGHDSFVPLREATLQGDEVTVPYDKEPVKDAPRVAADEELTAPEEDRLYAHYSLGGGSAGSEGGVEPAGYDTSGPTTDNAMTRSEERLHVGTEKV